MHAAFEAFIEAQKFKPTKQSVFVGLLETLLKTDGFWPPKKADTSP